jgi:hypothetical protein
MQQNTIHDFWQNGKREALKKKNLNIQNILSKVRDEGPKIEVFTHGETKKRTNETNEGKRDEQWVKKSVVPIPTFDP